MKIGLIGVGLLGIAIAKNIIKAGHDLYKDVHKRFKFWAKTYLAQSSEEFK